MLSTLELNRDVEEVLGIRSGRDVKLHTIKVSKSYINSLRFFSVTTSILVSEREKQQHSYALILAATVSSKMRLAFSSKIMVGVEWVGMYWLDEGECGGGGAVEKLVCCAPTPSPSPSRSRQIGPTQLPSSRKRLQIKIKVYNKQMV